MYPAIGMFTAIDIKLPASRLYLFCPAYYPIPTISLHALLHPCSSNIPSDSAKTHPHLFPHSKLLGPPIHTFRPHPQLSSILAALRRGLCQAPIHGDWMHALELVYVFCVARV